jgi:hypothetical protein
MLQSLQQKILQIKEACGIEIILLPDDKLMISGVSVKLDKNAVVKQKEFHFVNSYDNLCEKISPKIPIVVTINGKGILHKKIEATATSEESFENILPNANPNQFFRQESTFGKFVSVAIARKELVENIVNQLKVKGFKVLSVSLGSADAKYLEPYLNFEKEQLIKCNTFNIFFDEEKKIKDVSVIQFDQAYNGGAEYNIGNQYVSAASMLAFGSCLGLFASGPSMNPSIEMDSIAKERTEFIYFKYFNAAKWAVLLTLFIILFINFFIYSHYFNKNSLLQNEIETTKNKGEENKKLQTEINRRESFLQSYGWDRPAKLSFFADRIAGMVPAGTVLTDMKLNPLKGDLKSDDHLLPFMYDTIQIIGTCDDPTELTMFGNNLKNIQSLSQVNVKSYVYRKEADNGIFSMEIITH